jgi:hypothetical protein
LCSFLKAQLAERKTLNLVVTGSSPVSGFSRNVFFSRAKTKVLSQGEGKMLFSKSFGRRQLLKELLRFVERELLCTNIHPP